MYVIHLFIFSFYTRNRKLLISSHYFHINTRDWITEDNNDEKMDYETFEVNVIGVGHYTIEKIGQKGMYWANTKWVKGIEKAGWYTSKSHKLPKGGRWKNMSS